MATHIESWKNERNRTHNFRGAISDRDLALYPEEIISRVKDELVSAIVERLMETIGPNLDNAIKESFERKKND